MGTQEIVDKIIKQIQDTIDAKENQVSETIDVPVKLHRNLIGAGGAARRQFEEKFGVLMNVPRQNSGETGVILTGLPDKVAKAKEHITAMTDSQKGESISVPRNLHHAVAQNGATFGELTRMGVRVDHAGQKPPAKPKSGGTTSNGDVPLITDQPGSGAGHVWEIVPLTTDEEGDIVWNLATTRDAQNGAVDRAKARIQELLEQASEPRFAGYLTLPDPKLHRRVIGQGGQNIDSMRITTGCDIQVPRKNGGGGDAITITGSEEGVLQARDLILEAVQGGN
jgi:rRNA processing protein Krr1/Pno1